jgi:hypothetical protein
MRNSPRDRRYRYEIVRRLEESALAPDEEFLRALDDFLEPGLERLDAGQASPEQFEDAITRLTGAIAEYRAPSPSPYINADVFDSIRASLCPGFWPFC